MTNPTAAPSKTPHNFNPHGAAPQGENTAPGYHGNSKKLAKSSEMVKATSNQYAGKQHLPNSYATN
jgi:hypothetical protein